MGAPLPCHRTYVSCFGRCGHISAFLALPHIVRLFLSLKTFLTRFIHYLKLSGLLTIVWASLGTDSRIFFRLMSIFASALLQLHSNHAGTFVIHKNTPFLRIPRFSMRLWWVFLLLWTLFIKSSPSHSTLRFCSFSLFRLILGWPIRIIRSPNTICWLVQNLVSYLHFCILPPPI